MVIRLASALALVAALTGCVVAPAGPGYGYEPAPAYGYGPGYYAAPQINDCDTGLDMRSACRP